MRKVFTLGGIAASIILIAVGIGAIVAEKLHRPPKGRVVSDTRTRRHRRTHAHAHGPKTATGLQARPVPGRGPLPR